MYWCEIGRRPRYERAMGHTCEGPDVFPGTSLPDRTGVDGGSHGAEGKTERKGVRLYTLVECIRGICDAGDLGSTTGLNLAG